MEGNALLADKVAQNDGESSSTFLVTIYIIYMDIRTLYSFNIFIFILFKKVYYED